MPGRGLTPLIEVPFGVAESQLMSQFILRNCVSASFKNIIQLQHLSDKLRQGKTSTKDLKLMQGSLNTSLNVNLLED